MVSKAGTNPQAMIDLRQESTAQQIQKHLRHLRDGPSRQKTRFAHPSTPALTINVTQNSRKVSALNDLEGRHGRRCRQRFNETTRLGIRRVFAQCSLGVHPRGLDVSSPVRFGNCLSTRERQENFATTENIGASITPGKSSDSAKLCELAPSGSGPFRLFGRSPHVQQFVVLRSIPMVRERKQLANLASPNMLA